MITQIWAQSGITPIRRLPSIYVTGVMCADIAVVITLVMLGHLEEVNFCPAPNYSVRSCSCKRLSLSAIIFSARQTSEAPLHTYARHDLPDCKVYVHYTTDGFGFQHRMQAVPGEGRCLRRTATIHEKSKCLLRLPASPV